MCLHLLLPRMLGPQLGLGTTGHPVGPVLPVRQTGEDLLTQIGEVVLVPPLPPLEVAGLEMLLIPETIELNYQDTLTNQKDKERHVRGDVRTNQKENQRIRESERESIHTWPAG